MSPEDCGPSCVDLDHQHSDDPGPDELEYRAHVSGCTCNAIYCGPGSGHESYCGWEQG